MMLKVLAMFALAGLLLGARAAAAQRLAPPFPTVSPLQLANRFPTAEPHRTYWLEGGLIGGIGLGLFGVYAGTQFCATSDATRHCGGTIVGAGLLGAATGFAAGALIGHQFGKHQ